MQLPDFFLPAPAPVKELLTPADFHDYEKSAEIHCLIHNCSMLWLGMGLGKTVISLSVILTRMRSNQVKKVLIFGPLRVIQSVWEVEARKWSHTKHLRFSVMHGTKSERLRALFTDSDIYLCNYENMNWLAAELQRYFIKRDLPLPFEMIIYDEVSKMKNSTSLRMQGGIRDRVDSKKKVHSINISGWRKLLDLFTYRIGLTGTPASNGYIDLHGQYLSVDGGVRLGEYITNYRDRYFSVDHMGWKYKPTVEGKVLIEGLISDITLNMEAKDYLDLPPVKVSNLMVDLPPAARRHYNEIEKEMFTELDSGCKIELFSKSSISNKLLQICNGQPYVNQSVHSEGFDVVHEAKLDALADVIEEAAGSPVLCSYTFRPDADRIMKRFRSLRPVNLTSVPSTKTASVIQSWKDGNIRLMIGHPASIGHGIDGLQEGGHIVVWFGINWSLELYDQMNLRIAGRQGQVNDCLIIRILCRDTVDLAVADAIERKNDDQNGLRSAIQRYRDGTVNNDLELTFF